MTHDHLRDICFPPEVEIDDVAVERSIAIIENANLEHVDIKTFEVVQRNDPDYFQRQFFGEIINFVMKHRDLDQRIDIIQRSNENLSPVVTSFDGIPTIVVNDLFVQYLHYAYLTLFLASKNNDERQFYQERLIKMAYNVVVNRTSAAFNLHFHEMIALAGDAAVQSCQMSFAMMLFAVLYEIGHVVFDKCSFLSGKSVLNRIYVDRPPYDKEVAHHGGAQVEDEELWADMYACRLFLECCREVTFIADAGDVSVVRWAPAILLDLLCFNDCLQETLTQRSASYRGAHPSTTLRRGYVVRTLVQIYGEEPDGYYIEAKDLIDGAFLLLRGYSRS